MSRSKGARLYLDPKRKQWVVRDRHHFVRTGETDENKARAHLEAYRADDLKRCGGFVYFITAAYENFPIKIGFTAKLACLRMQHLQTGCPYPLYVIGHTIGTMAKEREIHATFDHLKLVGEWFRRDSGLVAYISNICENAVGLA